MARTRVVTRTIIGVEYDVMTVDTTTSMVSTSKFTLTGEKLTLDKALKKLQKMYDTDTLKLVSIQHHRSVDCIYGMLESDFVKYAKRMDDERHFVNEEVDIDTDEEDDIDEE